MSVEVSATPPDDQESPSSVRYFVLAVTTLMSVLLYLDRFAIGIASEYIREDLKMTQTQMASFVSAFFWSYALCQVPAGWFSDRFGARAMLTVYIVAWSVFTGLMGVAHSVVLLLWLRFFCGIAQAGAYPTAVGLIRNWFPVSQRGLSCSIVGLGGRFGGVLAPVLTAWLIVHLETLFPVEIRTSKGPGWRPTIVLYGIVGMIVAAVFAYVVRNNPKQHPKCTAAEKSFIDDEATQKVNSLEPQNPSFPWRAFLKDISLWGNSVTQFLTNVGWLFLIATLPRYLEKVHGVPLVTIGIMTAFPIGTGIIGMFAGGRWSDWGVRHFGLKWGRRLPLVISRFTAASGYGYCVLLGLFVAPGPEKTWLPWLYVVGLCIASGSADLGTPSIWAYCQDVGGRYTASILGWGNMWGNLGAAVAPFIYNKCLGENPALKDWNAVFAICCVAFLVSGLSAMLLDATKPLTADNLDGRSDQD